jgi:hypothetical protein
MRPADRVNGVLTGVERLWGAGQNDRSAPFPSGGPP